MHNPSIHTFCGWILVTCLLLPVVAWGQEPQPGETDQQVQPADQATEDQSATRPLVTKQQNPPGDLDTGQGLNTSELLQQMVALLLVIGVLIAAGWIFVRKVMPRIRSGSPGRKIRVIETTYINPRLSLHLLQVGSRTLLLASGQGGANVLSDVTDGFEGAASEAGFQEVLDAHADDAEQAGEAKAS